MHVFGGSGYDDEDRLVNWERSDNNLDQAWNLSLVGNWNSITENASTQSRTHGPTHEMLTAAGASVSHDVKGNITLIPAVLRPTSDPLTIVWDFDNRLVSADVDNDSTADVFYKWDALGRRVLRDDGTTATVFVQSGQQTIADYTSGTAASSPTYTYVYASYIDEPVMRGGTGGLRYYHRNQQYSITALTNGSGTITERYAYSAYGTPTITDASGTVLTSSADNSRYTYTGREYDETLALYHYRARMYDSVAGRLVSRDPIGFAGGKSFYQFTSSRPCRYTDPLGLSESIMTTGSYYMADSSRSYAPGSGMPYVTTPTPEPSIIPVHPPLPPPKSGGLPPFTPTTVSCTCNRLGASGDSQIVDVPCAADLDECCSDACADLGPDWVNPWGGFEINGSKSDYPTLSEYRTKGPCELGCNITLIAESALCAAGGSRSTPFGIICEAAVTAEHIRCTNACQDLPE